MKRIEIAVRPGAAADAEKWVGERPKAPPAEPRTRLTLDIPTTLHRIIKSSCAQRGTRMRDEIELLLQNHYQKEIP